MEMRAKWMVLILMNLVMAAVLAIPRGGKGGSAPGIFDCCQGKGAETYCCRQCCWSTRDCKADRDCQTPERQ